MRQVAAGVIIAGVLTLTAGGCGGRDTVASRSAAAYREAVEKGIPIEDDHGGHAHDQGGAVSPEDPAEHHEGAVATADHHDASATDDHADHSKPAEGDHAGHGAPEGPTHEAMRHDDTAEHAQHGVTARTDDAAQHAQHGATVRSGDAAQHAQHGATVRTDDAAQHAQHETMQHEDPAQHGESGATSAAEHGGHGATLHGPEAHAAIPPGGLWGPVPGAVPGNAAAAPALPMAPLPTTSAEMNRLRPDATLSRDRGDTPAAIAVIEAQKSAGSAHEGHGAPAAGEQHDHDRPENPPR